MDFEPKNSDSTNIYFPLAIYPPYLDNRMSAQKACFTIFGNKLNGLLSIENCPERILDSVIISGDAKEKMMSELRLLGINFESIYPDLDGLGSAINSKYERQFYDTREAILKVLQGMQQESNEV